MIHENIVFCSYSSYLE